jgi:hypothetical protein
VGLPVAIAVGMARFDQLLAGAHNADLARRNGLGPAGRNHASLRIDDDVDLSEDGPLWGRSPDPSS